MLRNYLLAAIRHLLKNKLFTATNILGLAIGMTVSLLILNYVNFEFSYDNMHHNANRIYRVESRFFEGSTMTDDCEGAGPCPGSECPQSFGRFENTYHHSVSDGIVTGEWCRSRSGHWCHAGFGWRV
ncbi:hypothetical protein [Prolixibacter sp. SD074]|jgi:putative ABC transport system permease protein|uniref:hypothetical protein n=1 Tax=Prolixibacter sp. SD074 TaxID=2652391 RepID=UPI001E2AE2ED|nr:hypothetical protein [Prolixibacter sp. SD074]